MVAASVAKPYGNWYKYSRIIPTSRSFKCKYDYEAIRIKFAKNSEHYPALGSSEEGLKN